MVGLPNIDQYRQPFIEPLGCLTLLAALCDHALINIIAIGRAGSQDGATLTHFHEAADLVRHWKPQGSAALIKSFSVEPRHLSETISNALSRFSTLREQRHRAIHDAVSLGWDEAEGLMALATGYLKEGGKTKYRIERIEPEEIASLAGQFSDLRADLDHCLHMLLQKGSAT